MSKQQLTVARVNGETWDGHVSEDEVPGLELVGLWLEDVGFPVGARVEVEVVEPGRLVMTRQDLGGPVPNLLPLVWVPVERLAAIEEAREDAEASRG